MPADKIYIGNFRGLVLNRKPFNIDNETFAALFNAYAWRAQVKRKRGTSTLARFQRQIKLVASVVFPWQFAANLTSGSIDFQTVLGLESGATLAPGTIKLTVNGNAYTEPVPPDGTLLKGGVSDPGSSVNYATTTVTIAGGGNNAVTGTFGYFPDLPVLGLEDYVPNIGNTQFPLLIGFDTKYAYQINQTTPPFFFNVSYYKNSNVPFVWSGQDYQQFWSSNYQHAFWVSNNKPGFNFVNGTYVAGSGTPNITFNFTKNSVPFTTLVVGDILWFNEWPGSTTINGNKNTDTNGVVTDISGAASGNYVVTFTNVETVSGMGIAQLLTNTIPGQDGIKWYDGDPTSNSGIPTGSTATTPPFSNNGWVNFAPPLTAGIFSIDDEIAEQYYLVGALHITPFKDRILFTSPWIQNSSNPNPIQLQDVVLWSWNGTPYYTSLVPTGANFQETFDARSYYVDQVGFGGYLPAGISKPIKTLSPNEDVLLIGFGGTGKKTRFVYTGNDLQPFLFYLINSEMPSSSTFSVITMDDGMIDVGQYGVCKTNQQQAARIDLMIPDEVFKIQASDNGQDRVNSARNFLKEWIYFSYPTGDVDSEEDDWKFPTQTFMWNYRENTWSILKENYTHHGSYRPANHYTWATLPFKTWADWREPWNAGSTTQLFAETIAGNPQGYVLEIDNEGTGEAPSGDIQAIADDGLGNTQITSPNHCVDIGDYLYFLGALGSTFLNGNIGRVISTIDANNFVVDYPFTSGTYLGLGTYTRLSQPLIQTKQFPFYWDQGRKVRIGVQKYLLEATDFGQITLNMYLSQDSNTVWNLGPIDPDPNAINTSLMYSQVLYTCPEQPANLAGPPANITFQTTNLNMQTAASQDQIWHRVSTSLIGDTVQLGFTLNDAQMRNLSHATDEIVLHAMQIDVYPSMLLS